MKSIYTILLLIASNIFMTIAWYGHLKFKEIKDGESLTLIAIIFISWLLALPEYIFQVPANRLGFQGQGGPFTLLQLKVIQEVVSLLVFIGISIFLFKSETLRVNHFIGLIFLILAVYFIFKK